MISDGGAFAVSVNVRHPGEPDEKRDVDDPDGEMTAKFVRDQEGLEDVTLVVQIAARDDRMLVAISGGHAFVGLDGPSGIFQFRHREAAGGESVVMPVGGQPTQIARSYVWSVQDTAEITRGWITGIGNPHGEWERQ